MTPDSLNPCVGFSGLLNVWFLLFKVCFTMIIPKEWVEDSEWLQVVAYKELPHRAMICLMINNHYFFAGILIVWLLIVFSVDKYNTMIKTPSAKTLAIRKAIIDSNLVPNEKKAVPDAKLLTHAKKAVPARRSEDPTRWFVALYFVDKPDSYPATLKLEDGTEVDIECFSYDRPSEHDWRDPDPNEIMHIEEVNRKHMGEFTNRRNINMIAQEGKSILIGVSHAGMLYEDEEPIPKELDGVPVIVREGRFITIDVNQ